MVGLSVVLEAEGYEDISSKRSAHHQVISKASMIIKPSPSSPTPPTSPSPFTKRNSSFNLSCGTSGFLDYCFLCRQKLLPGKDIYMYKNLHSWWVFMYAEVTGLFAARSAGADRYSWMKKKLLRLKLTTVHWLLHHLIPLLVKGPKKEQMVLPISITLVEIFFFLSCFSFGLSLVLAFASFCNDSRADRVLVLSMVCS
nr:uncharacterized protein LOC113734901 isoform X1 [Coffea arabica]XP_027120265.1 uncharacterized protein LOC113737201 isoform X1 [Coffea arabica]